MALTKVTTKKTLIGSLKDELIGGKTLSEFKKELEAIDVNDAKALQAAAKRPKNKCNDWTIVVNIKAYDPALGGKNDSAQQIDFSFNLQDK